MPDAVHQRASPTIKKPYILEDIRLMLKSQSIIRCYPKKVPERTIEPCFSGSELATADQPIIFFKNTGVTTPVLKNLEPRFLSDFRVKPRPSGRGCKRERRRCSLWRSTKPTLKR